MESQVAFFREFAGAVGRADDDEERGLEPMLESLEADYFNNLVIVLDAYLADSRRDSPGPVAREVEALSDSLIHGEGELLPEPAARIDEGRSILGLKAGDSIRLTAQNFSRLADAYFAEIERRQGL